MTCPHMRHIQHAAQLQLPAMTGHNYLPRTAATSSHTYQKQLHPVSLLPLACQQPCQALPIQQLVLQQPAVEHPQLAEIARVSCWQLPNTTAHRLRPWCKVACINDSSCTGAHHWQTSLSRTPHHAPDQDQASSPQAAASGGASHSMDKDIPHQATCCMSI
jgi:hypothetical protein